MDTWQDVPALTLRNPWAELITWHGKDVENRTWKPPKQVTRFWVHAGVGRDPVPENLINADQLNHPVAGAIVSLVQIDGVCEASRLSGRVLCACGRWAVATQFHWRIRLLGRLTRPVPCRGTLGLWVPTPPVRDAAAQLVLAA